MSAPQLAQVYQKIIDDVINDSASTFDEDGVERQLLNDLRTAWESKLTARNVGTMPWDPAPAPTPLNLPPQQIQPPTPASSATPAVKPEPVIKQESNYADYASPNVVPASQHGAGLQRAGQFIQDKFGTAANGSLSALQSAQAARAQVQQSQQNQQTQQAQVSPTQHAQLNGLSPDAQRQAYNRLLAEQMRQQQARAASQQRSVTSGQTDGADEWRAFVAERRALSDASVLSADISLRERIQQQALEMEGGGLMLPASQVKIPRIPIRRNRDLKRAQVDGADSDDEKKVEEDEDAINSDLDDPDDDAGVNSEDEENNGEVMVCLYDKVQRVKNKWKGTLKDGILSTGGKEYVFNKAQGEFEW